MMIDDPSAGQKLSETTRTEAFSDGVFAIAITLLILEIEIPPHGSAGGLGRALLAQWPSYLAFFASFASIGVMWINHHRLFAIISRSNDALLVLNLFLLLGITWVPFPTALLADYLGHPGQRTAAMVYGGSFFFMAVAFNVLWGYATTGGRLLDAGYDREAVKSISRQYAFGPLLYAITFALGTVSATSCLVLSALLAIFFALPPSLLSRKARAA